MSDRRDRRHEVHLLFWRFSTTKKKKNPLKGFQQI